MEDNYTLRIKNFINRNSSFIFNDSNIRAMGIGNKKINGEDTSIPTLTFLVNKKLYGNNISREKKIPKWINGILTDVIESEDLIKSEANAKPRNPQPGDPAIGGCEISKEDDKGVGGVIAYAVTERKRKIGLYLLSAQHILAKDITKGSEVNRGIKIYYPRVAISNLDPRAMVGVYSNGIPIKLGKPLISKAYNDVDAAIAWVGPNSENTKKKSLKIGVGFGDEIIKVQSTAKVQQGEKIYIMNYDTGKKLFGIVEIINATVKAMVLGKETSFKNQTITSMYYDNGLSGALGITVNGNKAFGMLMCGEKGFADISYKAYFNDIDKILELLDIELATDL